MEGSSCEERREVEGQKSKTGRSEEGIKSLAATIDPLWAWLHIPLPQPSSPPLAVTAARPAWRRATQYLHPLHNAAAPPPALPQPIHPPGAITSSHHHLARPTRLEVVVVWCPTPSSTSLLQPAAVRPQPSLLLLSPRCPCCSFSHVLLLLLFSDPHCCCLFL